MEINNEQLVGMFGTDANKIKYSNDRRVNTSFKSTLLNRAKKQYEIVIDLGKGKYKIDKKKRVTLFPSVHRMVGCKSHFFIRKGKIAWCK